MGLEGHAVSARTPAYQFRRARRFIVRRVRDMNKGEHDPLDIEELTTLLAGSDMRWRVTGMAAANRYFGATVRQPHDLDVSVAWEDAHGVPTSLPSWQHYYVDEQAWFRWRGRPLPPGVRRLVSRRGRGKPWAIECSSAST